MQSLWCAKSCAAKKGSARNEILNPAVPTHVGGFFVRLNVSGALPPQLRPHPGPSSRDRHAPSKICLPIVRRRDSAGPGTRSYHRRRSADRGHFGICLGLIICRSFATLSASPDLQPSGDRSGSLNPGRLGFEPTTISTGHLGLSREASGSP